MDIPSLQKWLVEPRPELIKAVAEGIRIHVDTLRSRGTEFETVVNGVEVWVRMLDCSSARKSLAPPARRYARLPYAEICIRHAGLDSHRGVRPRA